jgi:hypothetical protein
MAPSMLIFSEWSITIYIGEIFITW